jgi:hypothetical protein
MKRKLLLSSAVLPALLATGATAQVVNFHDANSGDTPISYDELFAGQGAYSDPGNDIWNGFGAWHNNMYGSTYFYSSDPGAGGGVLPQQFGNPGNPYAAYLNSSGVWVTSTGPSLFEFTGSPTNSGNATSGGQFTPITLSVSGPAGDTGTFSGTQDGAPNYLLGEAAYNNGSTPDEVFTLHNVPAGTYGLYLYGANYNNNRGTMFSVNSGTAHNGIAATLNSNTGTEVPATSFVEGQNFVIFENVTPDASNNITITGSPNPQDGVGNANLTNETDINGFQLIFNPPPTAVGSTAAQNVWAGGTASFSFSPAFASGATFQWQSVIGGVTNNLANSSTFAGVTTTNLTVTSVATGNVGLYQCVITTGTATNTSPAAPLTILTSTAASPLLLGGTTTAVGYVLQPGDTLTDVNNDFTQTLPYNTVPPPWNMTVEDVVDGTLSQYINYGSDGGVPPFAGPAGFTVTPTVGASIVTGLRFFTTSRDPEDNPADYTLLGSTDGGATFTPIAGGLLALPAQRNAGGGPINITNQVLEEIDFANSTPYTTYELEFTNVSADDTASNGVEVAEIQFLGSLAAVAPGVAQQPPSSEELLTGATFQPSVVANGAGPFSYKWYYGTTALAGATNAMLMVPDVQSANDGNYYCAVSNPYGTTNSVTVNLNVVAPTPYEKSLQALGPMAYWPLNENSGTVAYDTIGGYNGVYNGNVTLGQPGVTDSGFGSPSYSALFDGSSAYVDIPEGPFNITGGITTIVWVNLTVYPSFSCAFGHGDSSWRMSVNGSGQPGAADGGAGDATSGTSVVDGNWHMLAYSYSGDLSAQNNGALYVDGVLVANDSVTTTPAGDALDVWIGGAPDYGTGRLLNGSIAHAAIFNTGLTSNQIAAIYYGADPAPIVSVPATATVNLNGSVTIPTSIVGKPPFVFQWFDIVGGVSNVIAGATNSGLTLTDVQAVQSTYQYFVEVSNVFGSFTSSVVALNILSGQPTLQADINPLLVEVPPGVPITFSVTVTGTEPFAYQWANSSGPIAGATDSDYTFDALAGSNNYSVTVTNSVGAVPSSTAVVLGLTNPSPVIGFNGNGSNWTLNQGSGWPGAPTNPSIVNDLLTLTDGTNGENSSAFYDTPEYIGGFIASFTYVGNGGADGVTFCIQNSTNAADGLGLNAVGGGGGDLGYAGVTPSAALELNIYSGDHGGTGYLFATGGSTPDSDSTVGNFLSCSPVVLSSGDPIYIQLYYDQDVLDLWFTDTKSKDTFATTMSVPDLPATVGAPSAFVGFTGATGGVNSIQTVSNFVFSYTTPPILSIENGSSGSVVVSWPDSVSSLFVLRQAAAIDGPWEIVPGTPVVVNAVNEVTVTAGPATAFFKLSLQ